MRWTRRFATILLTVGSAAVGCSDAPDDLPSHGTGRGTDAIVSSSSAASATSGVRPSAGCDTGADGTGPFIADEAIDVHGTRRRYRIASPAKPGAGKPAPLVLALHGARADGATLDAVSELSRLGPERGVVVVLPEGEDGDWELAPDGPDADFLVALLDHVEATRCIDLDRIHGIGMSMGAWKIALTACTKPGRFASLSLVTVEVFPGDCEPMPVVAFHGTADVLVPYGEGGDEVVGIDEFNASLPGALDNIAAWAASADCPAAPTETRVEPDVRVRTHGPCPDGAEVVLYTIEGGGHTWPGSPLPDSFGQKVTRTISATERSLEFFDAHPRTSR